MARTNTQNTQIREGGIGMSEQVLARLVDMVAGSLQYYANESRCDEDEWVSATMLEELAGRIADGTATDGDWLEALDQIDVSDTW